MNFSDWAPLKLVDSDWLKSVRLCYVFGKTGHEALMVTDEDEVFACGSNFKGCLGFENGGPIAPPLPVLELSKKKVKGFSSCQYKDGAVFVCALTSSGHVYFWGNKFTRTNTIMNPTLIPSVSKKVSELECGVDHSLILTVDGEVYSWGYNDYGQLGHGTINVPAVEIHYHNEYDYYEEPRAAKVTDRDTPTLVLGDLKNKIVIKISCGTSFSVAVLDNGEVYTWGCNTYGQLGVDVQSFPNLKSPSRVAELNGIIIRQITCGASHVLAVSDVNELYSWGKNDAGQLGLGTNISHSAPARIEDMGKVIDIATTSDGSTSAAMTEHFKVYMWGTCGGLYLRQPTETRFETLHEVFAYFGNPRVTYKPKTRQFQFESVSESLKNAFNNVVTSDLTIVAENKEIFVHKAILQIRSNYFQTMLQEPWVKEGEKTIQLDRKYDAIYAYLKYIYTDDLEVSPETAIELLKMAEEYQDLVLKNLSEKCIKFGITTDNVADLYMLASDLNAKKLAKYCLTFASNHVGKLIQTPGFRQWDKRVLIEFIEECHERKKFRC